MAVARAGRGGVAAGKGGGGECPSEWGADAGAGLETRARGGGRGGTSVAKGGTYGEEDTIDTMMGGEMGLPSSAMERWGMGTTTPSSIAKSPPPP